MYKKDLIVKISKQTGLTQKNAEKVINSFYEIVSSELKQNNKIVLSGFGSFRVREHAARKWKNPRTGKVVKIPKRKIPYFKPGKTLCQEVVGEKKAAAAKKPARPAKKKKK